MQCTRASLRNEKPTSKYKRWICGFVYICYTIQWLYRHNAFSLVFFFPKETLSDEIDPITWSLILALGVCYQARLTYRDKYRETVAKSFRQPCRLPGGAERIEREISR